MSRGVTRLMLLTVAALAPAAFLLAADAPKALPAPQAKVETSIDKIPGFPLVNIEMVKIPAGTIEIKKGDEVQKVEIKSIWIGRTELTWEAYDPYAMKLDLTDDQKAQGVDADSRPSNPYGAPDRGFGHEGYPAISVAANAADMYCKWLSKKTGKKYRLATEAEWEYACRAGGTGEKVTDKEKLKNMAWFADNSEVETGDRQTHAVAQKEPNAWGIYDMLGNVGEWVVALDGTHVLAGGNYDDRASKIHCGSRSPYDISWQMRDPQDPKSKWWLSDGPFAGFRIVRED